MLKALFSLEVFMDATEIVKYLEMEPAALDRLVLREDPPLPAVWARAVREFMEAYHLRDREDALRQFVRLRRFQADRLGLSGDDRDAFMGGLDPGGE